MANSKKFTPDELKSFFRKSEIRKDGCRPKRYYYLIVCEGKKTEPNYFEAIKQCMPKEMVSRVTISGAAKNTLSLLREVEKIVEERNCSSLPPYHNIWIVFDRDSFNSDDFDNAIRSIEEKNSSDSPCIWKPAWSNEAFELWYIFHFRDETGGALSRTAYQAIIETEMKQQLSIDRKYRKNALDMFKLLRDRTPLAICRAETALHKHSEQIPFHDRNPATTVFELVRDLAGYLPNGSF